MGMAKRSQLTHFRISKASRNGPSAESSRVNRVYEKYTAKCDNKTSVETLGPCSADSKSTKESLISGCGVTSVYQREKEKGACTY
jgi:hypothetical protein